MDEDSVTIRTMEEADLAAADRICRDAFGAFIGVDDVFGDADFLYSRWRAAPDHRLELRARLDPSHAEELLSQAQRYDSAKYAALALAHLGRRNEATDLAKKTHSDLLVAHVAPESVARRAAERIAAGLPTERRSRFLERGPWIAPWT